MSQERDRGAGAAAVRAPPGQRLSVPVKFALAIGYLALALGVIVARRTPATTYELSIYGATPLGFWLGIGAALVLALLVLTLPGVRGPIRRGALALASGSVVAVAALPIVRGYHFYGAGDSLTHLGWVRDISAGVLSPLELLYPGVHVTAVFVQATTGIGSERALQLVVLAFVVAFLIFIPLCVRAVIGTNYALVLGVLAALLLVPLNNIGLHLMAHPATQAVLFVPYVLYLLAAYLRSHGSGPRRAAIGGLLALSALALLVVHPQMALALLGVFVTISAAQFVYRRTGALETVARQPSLYAHTAVLGVAFVVWTLRFDRATGTMRAVADALLSGATGGSEVAQRTGTLAALGGSTTELFVKLFLPAVVLAAFAGLVVLASATGRLDDTDDQTLVRYVTVALLPVLALFGLVFIVDQTFAFRYHGFVMALVTVAAVVGVRWVSIGVARVGSRGLAQGVVVALFALLLPVAIMTMFASPFVYQPSQHVTEEQVAAHDLAFEQRESDVLVTGVAGGTDRYVDAIYGTTIAEDLSIHDEEGGVPAAAFGPNLTSAYESDRYIVVTDRNRATETELYDGVRYAEAGYETLERHPNIHRVGTTGDVQVYRLHADTDESNG